MRVAIVGNCQARPLATRLTSLVPSIEITGLAIVHLLRDAQADEYAPVFEAADVIVAQQVAPNYPCAFVRTEALRNRYGTKILAIVNLYYAGYNPELTYVRTPEGTVGGPLGDYHLEMVLDGWLAGASVDECVAALGDEAQNDVRYGAVPQRSLEDLARRERAADVKITDYIERQRARSQLFHTMNHPSNLLLDEYARRILAACDRPVETERPLPPSEMLGQFRLPLNPAAKRWLGLDFDGESHYVGLGAAAATGTVPRFQGRATYSSSALVDAFYRVYDFHGDRLREHLRAKGLSGVQGPR